ncbi:uncharacterized protein JCM6883_003255 [Sporobolomyces salmoneus]|uniref:uncharacterized protein n=1 Tax=Sporobolomyces salmoneus TaxID=183962 RepID=UPI00316D85FB
MPTFSQARDLVFSTAGSENTNLKRKIDDVPVLTANKEKKGKNKRNKVKHRALASISNTVTLPATTVPSVPSSSSDATVQPDSCISNLKAKDTKLVQSLLKELAWLHSGSPYAVVVFRAAFPTVEAELKSTLGLESTAELFAVSGGGS